MTCKLDHTDAAVIPQCLCRACTPVASRPMIQGSLMGPNEYATGPLKSAKQPSRLRRLRAEEKRLGALIDEIGQRDPKQKAKLYAALKVVEDDITKAGG